MTAQEFWEAMTLATKLKQQYGKRITSMRPVEQGKHMPVAVTLTNNGVEQPARVFTLVNGVIVEVK